jgi:hypothetical protein
MKNDETIGNFKKKYTVAVVFLIIVTLVAIGSEIFTTKYVSDQKKRINQSITNSKRISVMQSEVENLIAQQVKNESDYIKALDKVMSEKELQIFKSSLFQIASKYKVNLSIKKDEPIRDVTDYKETKLIFETLSTYEAYKKFKEQIANLNYFINFEKEVVKRENENSNQIKVSGEIYVIVFSKKEETISEFNKNNPIKKPN